MKKIIVLASILMVGIATSISLSSSSVTSPVVSQSIFEKYPPIPTNFWVQKVQNPTDEEMIIRVKYIHDDNLPLTIDLYQGTGVALHLRDDGQYPDVTRGDSIYASLIDQDPQEFVNMYHAQYTAVQSKGHVLTFNGHLGTAIPKEEFRPFNAIGFNSFQSVEIDPILINEEDCFESVLKQHSLFITDLSVVEDLARTNYILDDGIGNEEGAWTIGTMLKNMAGGLSDPPTSSEITKVRNFVKEWLKSISGTYTHNGITSQNPRDPKQVYDVLIAPWIMRAKGESNYNGSIVSDSPTASNYWENIWDEFDTEEELNTLLGNAPFKLTAIVNRMDLRHNAAYSGTLSKAGETRFIFTLIAAYSNITFHNNGWAGRPPNHVNIDDGNPIYIWIGKV